MLEDDDDLGYEEDPDYEPTMKPCPVCDGEGCLWARGSVVLCPACQGEGTIENC